MTYGLTHNEAAALTFIRERLHESGVAPSYVEIAQAIGFSAKSKGAVSYILNALEQRGHIHRLKRHARAIALGPRPAPTCCPHCHRSLEAA